MSNPDVDVPAPTSSSPTGENGPAARADGDPRADRAARDDARVEPAPRSSVAESLADIRADRIIADARREAQAIIDAARVEARREARGIVDAARSEAENIITEAFEQRARIVRRDWAIGEGDWATTATARDEADGASPMSSDGSNGDGAPGPGARTEDAPAPDKPTPSPLAELAELVELAELAERTVLAELAGAPTPPSGTEVVSQPAPDPVRETVVSELIEAPSPRPHDRAGRPPPAPPDVLPRQPLPPLPARRPRGEALPRDLPVRQRQPLPPPPSADVPPPPPPPRTPPRPRPRVERELPAGMRIPPDVPDWDDDYDDDGGR